MNENKAFSIGILAGASLGLVGGFIWGSSCMYDLAIKEATPTKQYIKDVNNDGFPDLVSHYQDNKVYILFGDKDGHLSSRDPKSSVLEFKSQEDTK